MSTHNKDHINKQKFSDFFYNPITYCGVCLVLVIFVIECFLFGFDFLSKGSNVYLGIITYVILPQFLILGLILIPLGALRKRYRFYKGLPTKETKRLYINLAIPTHRNAVFVFIIGTSILIIMSAIGSYKAFNYTESVHFCGIICHKVMRPQYSVYLQSPHARVKCVDCHIGAGADWYVRSKLSGARQIYHTIKGDYTKPIPTPVHNLRPAKETCEQCHWPGKFYNSFELRRTYYPLNENEQGNWWLRMLVHVGGNETAGHGIHAHMYIDNEIYFYAEDEKRQKISWIKSVKKDGKATIYTSEDSAYKETEPPAKLIRKMDCMDCHNRPTHNFEAPYRLVNNAFIMGKIDPNIPEAKSKIMEVLSKEYPSTKEAVEKIQQKLVDYYQSTHPEFFRQHQEQITQLTKETISMYQNYFFPEMKARWDAYPNNIGHLWSPGCFRCHDGKHASTVGKTISRDCNICHTIIEQGFVGAIESSTSGLPFKHPFEDNELWQEMNCFDCHTGN